MGITTAAVVMPVKVAVAAAARTESVKSTAIALTVDLEAAGAAAAECRRRLIESSAAKAMLMDANVMTVEAKASAVE